MLDRLLEFWTAVFQHIVFFAIYSGAGWMLEVGYRSVRQREFVNAGFLNGPFLPIYGIGATLVLLLEPWLRPLGLVGELVGYGVVLTSLEYAIGAISEKAFGLRLWDYSDDPFNYDGRICLHFSVLWAVLAVGFGHWIHPAVQGIVEGVGPGALKIVGPLVVAYFAMDFAVSLNLLRRFVGRLSRVYLRRTPLSFPERKRLAQSFERLLVAFPNLRKYIDTVTNFRSRIDEKLSALQVRFLNFVESRTPREEEFRRFVRDIAVNREFLRTKEFRHHDSSIYRHALRVSFLAYRVGKSLDLDARAMARGGLLHDFFLYDWRDHDLPELARHKFHGLAHPHIALANARGQFSVTRVEGDIIVKHMWPLTLRPPMHLESFLVGCIDKYVAIYEFRGPRRRPTSFSSPAGEEKEGTDQALNSRGW